MKPAYLLIALGAADVVMGLMPPRQLGVVLTGAAFIWLGWMERNRPHSPWVEHPTLRAESREDKEPEF